MSFLIFLVLLPLLAAPVALVLTVLNFKRVRRLQAEVLRLSTAMNGQPGRRPEPVGDTVGDPAVEVPAAVVAVSTPPARALGSAPRPAKGIIKPKRRVFKPDSNLDFESILGGQWLTWVGILALFLGTAFFLGVDLGSNSLAGLPQILIGLAVALVFSLVGRYWSSRRERFLGLGLLGGGVALFYLASYAAYGFHQLISLPVVFPLLLAVATVGSLLALDRNSLTIASLTLVGAFLTPVVLRNGGDPTYALLPYLVAVNLGAVLVGLRRGWAGLPLTAFLATLVMVVDWWDVYYRLDLRTYAFVCVAGIWLLYSIAPWLRQITGRFWGVARAAVLAANGLFFGLFCYYLLAPDSVHLRGAALAVLAAVYLGISRLMVREKGEDEATRLTHFTGVALALIAIPVQLDLAWVTLGWIALAAVLLYAGLRESDRWHRYSGLAVLCVVMIRSIFMDIPSMASHSGGFRPVLNGEFLAGLALIAVLGWLFWAYRRYADRLSPMEIRLWSPLLIMAVVILAYKLSMELTGYFALIESRLGINQDSRTILWLTLLWAVYGFAALVIGVRTALYSLRVTGFSILGVAVLITTVVTVTLGQNLVPEYRPVFNLAFMQGAAVSVILGLLFWVFTCKRDVLTRTEYRFRTPVLMVAVLMLLVKISLEVLGYFLPRGDFFGVNLELKTLLTLSLVWAGYAGAVIVSGFVARFKPLRILGISLLGLTVLKVFLVDMQALDRGYRIVAFVGLGVLLLAISLLYQRERKTEAPEVGPQETTR